MVLERVYKDSELGTHTREPQDLLWTYLGVTWGFRPIHEPWFVCSGNHHVYSHIIPRRHNDTHQAIIKDTFKP